MRSSTRATSLGSLWAQYEPGRLAGSSSVNVPASTSCLQSSVVLLVGSVEPVDVVRLAQLDHLVTQARSRALRVGACTSATLRLRRAENGVRKLYRGCGGDPELVGQTWALGNPMSTSDPNRIRVARPSASRSKLTRWP